MRPANASCSHATLALLVLLYFAPATSFLPSPLSFKRSSVAHHAVDDSKESLESDIQSTFPALSEESLADLSSSLLIQDTENATSFDVQLSSLSELNKYSLDETPKILSQLSSYYDSLTSRSKSGTNLELVASRISPNFHQTGRK